MTREEAARRNTMQNELKPFCCYGKWKEGAEMTKEYIDREAALKKVIEVKHFDTELGGVVLHRYIKESDLKNIPAADAVDVVLCCECKHWLDAEGIEERDGVRFARCDVHNYLLDGRHTGWCPTENDFCSYGERKDSDWND